MNPPRAPKKLRRRPADSVDLVIGAASRGSPALWAECLRVLKPGAFTFLAGPANQVFTARHVALLEEAGFVTSVLCYDDGKLISVYQIGAE